jgi:hypothetical protein
MEIKSSRRTFLKVGIAGVAALAAAGSLYRFTRPAPILGKFILDGEAQSALGAIIPAILHGVLLADPQAVQSAMMRVQQAIGGLPLATQREVQDLFGLLALAPARRWLAGVPDRWQEAKPEDVSAFLQSWRFHRLAMLQSAYFALHDLILGSWYGDESTWDAIGYPGPIKELR